MKADHARKFTARYNKIMLYTLATVLLVSAILIVIQTKIKQQYDNEQLIEQFKTESVAIDNLIVRVTVLLNVLQTDAEAFFLNPRLHSSIYLKGLSNIKSDQYTLDAIPKPYAKVDAGNLTGAGNLNQLPKTILDEIEMAFSLNSAFKSTLQSIPNAAWVYYTSKHHFINIYPWVHSNDFQFTTALYQKDFYTLGVPEVNPTKTIFWTPIYSDEAGKGMMVTAAKPVYRQTEFLGTVAIDFTLGELADYVKTFRQDKGELFIINASGQLLAHPSIEPTHITNLQTVLPSKVALSAGQLPCADLELRPLGAEHQYICYSMQNAPWRALYLEKTPSLFSQVFSSIGTVFIILLSALGVMLIFMKKTTFREFIYPAEQLVEHISNQGANEHHATNALPQAWQPWFTKITETFDQNRTLINEIKQKNIELTDLNLSLERYMPKFVLVISLKNSKSGSEIASYFADAFAKKRDDKKTVYMEYPAHNNIQTQLGYEDDQPKYQHHNGFEIWNDFDFGHVPNGAESSVLMTKILNQYGNIVMHADVNGDIDHCIRIYLEPLFRYIKAIVVIVPADDVSGDITAAAVKKIQQYVRQDQATVYTLLNSRKNNMLCDVKSDFEIPYQPLKTQFTKQPFLVHKEAEKMIQDIVDRIERVHQVSIYIPTTINTDQAIDSTAYVEKTMAFLGEKFGGATSSNAQGVWNSDHAGMVSEQVYLVVSYTTEDGLNQWANDVIDFIKDLKQELKQDAMALEINKKMILV
ncbi:PDC sensor domain-containing protein [Pseudomonas sp. HK3]